ncbi:ABC transporter substrate-binding protein [uncultured Amnibacterium sp.]|uniref:ABC transporter substrate-binding protein n=1 Tax=uncultured Amnibacterium sp. TaxID=1631851 RepID=UPI0035CAD081
MTAPLDRRMFLIGIGGVAMATGLAACSAPGSGSPQANNGSTSVKTLSFLTNSDDGTAAPTVKTWNSGKHAFSVKLQQTDSSTYAQNFPRLATSSDAPGIAGYFIDGGLFKDLAVAGSLLDLTSLWDKSGLSANVPDLIKKRYAGYTKDGKYYGAPTNTSRYGLMFYRKSVLKKAGVAEPTNHEWSSLAEFEAACTDLMKAGFNAISVGGKDGYPLSHIQDGLLASTMEADLIAEPLSIDYTGEAWKAPVQKMVDWNKKGFFARGFLGRSTDQGNTLFGQGKAGFNTGMNVWEPLMLDAGVPREDLDWCLLPAIGDLPTKVSVYAGGGIVIPKVAAGHEQALEFGEYLVGKENALATAKSGAVIPARTDVPGLEAALGANGGSMFAFANQEGRSQFGWDDGAPTSMITYDRTNLQAVLAGSLSVDDFGAQLQKLKTSAQS